MAKKITYPVYIKQECRYDIKWLKLESANKGYELSVCKHKSKLNNHIRVFTGKGMISYWLRGLELTKFHDLKVKSGAVKECREIDFMVTFQEVREQTFAG